MFTRRHMLTITAAAGASGLLGSPSLANAPVAKWHGVALGGTASISVVHKDIEVAETMIRQAVIELRRLENIFSLYDPNSTLSRLNNNGSIMMPPAELVTILSTARQISEASNGKFDVTVQPLWDHYSGRTREAPAAILGQQHMTLSREMISLKMDQKITLNGIAQGAITDHLMKLFIQNGFNDLLLNAGEISAIGKNQDKDLWRIALGKKDGPVVRLQNMAVATSESVPLRPDGKQSRFFNPHTGLPESHFKRVSVVAPNATIADGLSTALMLCEEKDWPEILSRFNYLPLTIYLERKNGSLATVNDQIYSDNQISKETMIH